MIKLLNKATQGDCLSVLRSLPKECIDLVLTVPPYGIAFNSNWSKDAEYRTKVRSVDGIYNDGDDNTPFLSEVINELARVMKDDTHIYWFTRWDRVPMQLPLLQRHFNVKNALIWEKNNWSMGDLQGAYAGQYEVILFAQKGRRVLNEVGGRKRHTDILRFDRVPLIEFLMRKSSEPGEVVLDPFCGSGTTAAVAARLGRQFVTMDLDEDFVAIANQRISDALQAKEVATQ